MSCDDGITSSNMDSYLEIPIYRAYVLLFAESTDTLQRSALCRNIIAIPYFTNSYKNPSGYYCEVAIPESLDNK